MPKPKADTLMTRFGEQVAVIWIKFYAIIGLEVETIHDWRDVTFGGQSPEPGEEHLDELREAVKSKNLTLGVSTDGDGDRFGVIDANGEFIQPNQSGRAFIGLFSRKPRLDGRRGKKRGDIAFY